MAELGPGPHRSGEIADCLGVKVESVTPRRSGLIKKGMIFSPAHGDTAFTVPLFDKFLKRMIPDWTCARRKPGDTAWWALVGPAGLEPATKKSWVWRCSTDNERMVGARQAQIFFSYNVR